MLALYIYLAICYVLGVLIIGFYLIAEYLSSTVDWLKVKGAPITLTGMLLYLALSPLFVPLWLVLVFHANLRKGN